MTRTIHWFHQLRDININAACLVPCLSRLYTREYLWVVISVERLYSRQAYGSVDTVPQTCRLLVGKWQPSSPYSKAWLRHEAGHNAAQIILRRCHGGNQRMDFRHRQKNADFRRKFRLNARQLSLDTNQLSLRGIWHCSTHNGNINGWCLHWQSILVSAKVISWANLPHSIQPQHRPELAQTLINGHRHDSYRELTTHIVFWCFLSLLRWSIAMNAGYPSNPIYFPNYMSIDLLHSYTYTD